MQLNATAEAALHRQTIRLLVSDLLKCFEYVEPHASNINTFSHRFFELLLRASTEYESISQRVMDDLNMTRKKKSDMKDYSKLNEHFELSRCDAQFTRWNPGVLVVKPFAGWKEGEGPFWYKEYNSVKHSRLDRFEKANLINTLSSISACLILMVQAFGPHFMNSPKSVTGVDKIENLWIGDMPFIIRRPRS